MTRVLPKAARPGARSRKGQTVRFDENEAETFGEGRQEEQAGFCQRFLRAGDAAVEGDFGFEFPARDIFLDAVTISSFAVNMKVNQAL